MTHTRLVSVPTNPTLLHSPSLVAAGHWGRALEYETWPPISWHFLWLVSLNIGYDCHVSQCIVGSRDRRFSGAAESPHCGTAQTADKCLPLGLYPEIMKESTANPTVTISSWSGRKSYSWWWGYVEMHKTGNEAYMTSSLLRRVRRLRQVEI